MNEYIMAVDAGKLKDRGVFFVVRRGLEIVDGAPTLGRPDRVLDLFNVVHIDQFAFLPYPAFVDRAVRLLEHRDLAHNTDLVVDSNGVGEAVVDMMVQKGLAPVAILTTAGTHTREVYRGDDQRFSPGRGALRVMRPVAEFHVPKAELVRCGMILLAHGRVAIAKGAGWEEQFRAQLLAFREKQGQRSRKYEAEREEDHDDLVTAYQLAAWWSMHNLRSKMPEGVLPGQADSRSLEWDPLEHM